MTTFYMVECAFPFPDERAGFDEFYTKHITKLLSIEGFLTAQRFEATHEAKAPFMAIYELDEPAVLQRPSYTSRAGPSSVSDTYRPKMLNWDRNVVTGPAIDVDVSEVGWLIIIDRTNEDASALPLGFRVINPPQEVSDLTEAWSSAGSK